MFTVGFDLDLTLADTRRGIAVTYDALAAETGMTIDTDAVIGRLGIPLEAELSHWFPREEVPALADRYRALYTDLAVPATVLMPGAAEAVRAIRSRGGQIVIVTGKNQAAADDTVQFLELDVAHVAGGLFGSGKGGVLREFGATAFVGDHVGDVDAARAADVTSVAVATGPFGVPELRTYGADVVLADLGSFPGWLEGAIDPVIA